ncbi:VF530 family protein [Coraliomargarita sp. SDUM461003]|uniref:VF530 family protein n=1 Tax=Thalassobacterium maritimum TaxID=3041265 RepID=A0ABU1AUE3_9BACT|nr:VF530 family protein [Coraliomargarita sp. SDUM461003]MDQ8207793.1 VF530 family protein [Coraliomargarita sp. SDUM461003]
MAKEQINNPLHGLTLEKILVSLQEFYGWEGLAERLEVRCFMFDPSIKSSLKFLRKTPWARKKVEDLFIYTLETYGDEEAEAVEES